MLIMYLIVKEERKMNKLILTSKGLTTGIGRDLIGAEIRKFDLSGKRIFVFHEPNIFTEPTIREACISMGFEDCNIVFSSKYNIVNCDFYYVGEGNSYEILSLMRKRNVDKAILSGFADGNKVYIGSSAGAAIAGSSIEEMMDFDTNFVGMRDFKALGLYDGLIIPHYNRHELKNYIKNSSGIEDKYKNIMNVPNEGILVMEV